MPKLTRIYTRAGDDGTTGLAGGQRLKKHSPRIEALGAVDELNSEIGVALASAPDPELARVLGRVQNELFHVGADLSVLEEDKERMPVPSISQGHVDELERLIDGWNAEVGPLVNFILPGGSIVSAHLHAARAACRRAERSVVGLADHEAINPGIVKYLNRLSDALFVMARVENKRRGVADVCWDSRR
jgi:cob(I)alamin adenosyltransferase